MKVKFKTQVEYKPFERHEINPEKINVLEYDGKKHEFIGNVTQLEFEALLPDNVLTTRKLLDWAMTKLYDCPIYRSSLKLIDEFEIINLELYEENPYKIDAVMFISDKASKEL